MEKPIPDHGAGPGRALFALGFRPFFLGAGLFAILSIALWLGVYLFRFQFPLQSISSFQWHAHEMIYGYAAAVIAGFLLTAVRNWTGLQTLKGPGLAALFLLWCVARLLFGLGQVLWAGLFDLLFFVLLVAAVTRPIAASGQWRQMSVISKLMLLGLGNLIFYLGVLGILDQGAFWAIYGGLYIVLGLILTMGRRVIPAFTESGLGGTVRLRNSRWLDMSSLLFFFGFFISEMIGRTPALSAWLALGVALANGLRLLGWHTPAMWRKSLLWSLHLSFWLVALGFLLFALSVFAGVSRYLAIHAMAFGGIGLITLSMMCRVSLGHTGRGVNNPPRVLTVAFVALLVGVVFRVFLPMFVPESYTLWIALSALCWVLAFAIFVAVYLPILTRPRVDGQPG